MKAAQRPSTGRVVYLDNLKVVLITTIIVIHAVLGPLSAWAQRTAPSGPQRACYGGQPAQSVQSGPRLRLRRTVRHAPPVAT